MQVCVSKFMVYTKVFNINTLRVKMIISSAKLCNDNRIASIDSKQRFPYIALEQAVGRKSMIKHVTWPIIRRKV